MKLIKQLFVLCEYKPALIYPIANPSQLTWKSLRSLKVAGIDVAWCTVTSIMTTSAVIVKNLGKISLKMNKESLAEDYNKQNYVETVDDIIEDDGRRLLQASKRQSGWFHSEINDDWTLVVRITDDQKVNRLVRS